VLSVHYLLPSDCYICVLLITLCDFGLFMANKSGSTCFYVYGKSQCNTTELFIDNMWLCTITVGQTWVKFNSWIGIDGQFQNWNCLFKNNWINKLGIEVCYKKDQYWKVVGSYEVMDDFKLAATLDARMMSLVMSAICWLPRWCYCHQQLQQSIWNWPIAIELNWHWYNGIDPISPIDKIRVGRFLPITVKTMVIAQFLTIWQKYFLPRGETKFRENCHENTQLIGTLTVWNQ